MIVTNQTATPALSGFLTIGGAFFDNSEPDGKIADSELVFQVPVTLAPGEYRLEVRAVFGKADLRSGRLPATLTVPTP